MVRDYIQAARLRTLPLASACVLTGGALAGATGNVGFVRFIPLFTGCLVTVFLLQILANFANDLGDFENGADRAGRQRTGGPRRRLGPHHGGSNEAGGPGDRRIGLRHRCGHRAPCRGRCVDGALEVGGRWPGLHRGRLHLHRRQAALRIQRTWDISVLVFFGFAGVAGTAALITGDFEPIWLLPSATIGLLSVGVLNLNNLRDHLSDAATGKHTLVVRMGFRAGKVYHAALLIGAWVALLAFWQLDAAGPWRGQLWYGLFGLVHARHLAFVFRTEDPAELDGELKKIALSTFAISLFLFLSATA